MPAVIKFPVAGRFKPVTINKNKFRLKITLTNTTTLSS